jgi:hypothetical protein
MTCFCIVAAMAFSVQGAEIHDRATDYVLQITLDHNFDSDKTAPRLIVTFKNNSKNHVGCTYRGPLRAYRYEISACQDSVLSFSPVWLSLKPTPPSYEPAPKGVIRPPGIVSIGSFDAYSLISVDPGKENVDKFSLANVHYDLSKYGFYKIILINNSYYAHQKSNGHSGELIKIRSNTLIIRHTAKGFEEVDPKDFQTLSLSR